MTDKMRLVVSVSPHRLTMITQPKMTPQDAGMWMLQVCEMIGTLLTATNPEKNVIPGHIRLEELENSSKLTIDVSLDTFTRRLFVETWKDSSCYANKKWMELGRELPEVKIIEIDE